MKLLRSVQNKLKTLMAKSAEKGNLANAAVVLEKGKVIAAAESWVVSSCDATAHSESMLVRIVGQLKHSNYTPGLTMITVVEPCLMCLSACSQAGYDEVAYIIPAKKYIKEIPYMTDITNFNKKILAKQFSHPLRLVHLEEYEKSFCRVFENVMVTKTR
jgi:tRNA(Arg) A34 adenosine deaminase TadA